jgi:hypothetical protein
MCFFRKAGDKSLMVVLNKNNKDIELETARFNEVLNKHSEAVDIFSGEKTGIEDKMNVPAMSATILELYLIIMLERVKYKIALSGFYNLGIY